MRRDARQQGLGGDGKAVLFAQRQRNRRGAAIVDQGSVDRETGVGIDDLHAGPAEQKDRHLHGDLAAGNDDDLARIDRHTEAFGEVRADRFAERRNAGGRRVAVVPVLERLDRGLDDMRCCLEVRLTDAEVDDMTALGGQGGGAVEHLERPLVAQLRDVRRDVRRDIEQGAESPAVVVRSAEPTRGRWGRQGVHP